MRYYINKMKKITIEDIVFWIAILAIIGIIIWKLFGSPTDLTTLISIASLLVMSELALWKKLYTTERRVTLGFMKVRGDINLIRNDIKHHINYINQRFDVLESLIKRRN